MGRASSSLKIHSERIGAQLLKESSVLIARVISAVGLLCAVSAHASQSERYWLPDAETVERVEGAVRHMAPPTRGDWKATSIDSYGRYYFGMTLNGHKVVYGVFLSLDSTRYPPGI